MPRSGSRLAESPRHITPQHRLLPGASLDAMRELHRRAETDLIVRTVNCLEEEGIFTVRDLLNCTPQRLMEIPNLGEKTLGTIYAALEKMGFCRIVKQPIQHTNSQPPRKGFALLR